MSLKLDYLAFISQIVSYSDSQRCNLGSLNTASLCVLQLHLPYSAPKQVCAPEYTHTQAGPRMYTHSFYYQPEQAGLDGGISVCSLI